MIYGITVSLPGPGLDSRETFIGAQHRQAVASLQFSGERVNGGADRMAAAVHIQRITDDESLGLPLVDQRANPLPIRAVVAYGDDFQRRRRISQCLANRYADSFCAEVET